MRSLFNTLEKHSPKYTDLALSGRVWEDYARPTDIAEFLTVHIRKTAGHLTVLDSAA